MTARTGQEVALIALACLDLTSLNDADRDADVIALCQRAASAPGTPAALCVWSHLAGVAVQHAPRGVRVAAVANFPDGSTDLKRAVADTERIVQAGAHEVDVVLPYRALLAGDDRACAELLRAVRGACQGLTLKVILETGELREPHWMQRAARLALAERADFLKTSSGKTPVSATPEAAQVLLEAIAADARGRTTVGFKAAGGIRTVADAARYIELVEQILGPGAAAPARFRIGASALLNDIERVLGAGGGRPDANARY
ncbi:MAG TPA: deoxyribose-phosphate aldolase [Burkholderiaceae bacterium]